MMVKVKSIYTQALLHHENNEIGIHALYHVKSEIHRNYGNSKIYTQALNYGNSEIYTKSIV